jgi:asparagine synthase (glutamine-hydrolysing)
MTALAAIASPRGGPICEAHLAAMLAASPRPHDRAARWIDAHAGLACAAADTLPAEDTDEQPLVDAGRRIAVVFDGRLDNRDDLHAHLGLGGRLSDCRLVLEAFARWGEDAPARLLGDFAIILWDGASRRLLAARDHMGVRPLYFSERSQSVLCATDVAQLLAHPAVAAAPCEAVVADYLANQVRNDAATLYRDVRRVPAGHVLIADARGVRLRAYWRPEPRTAIRYRRDSEYADHCRELILRSVSARLRARRPAAALLSGGIDSSSVVCAGVRALRAGGPSPYSIVFPGHPESDESDYVRAVAGHCGIQPILVPSQPLPAAAFAAHAARWCELPAFPADEGARPLHRAIAAAGHRTALTGAGADFLFSGSIFAYADLLRQRRPLAALRRFRDDGAGASMDQFATGLIQAGIWPLLPARMKRLLRPLARRFAARRAQPAWLRLRVRDPERMPEAPRGGSYATEEIVRTLASGMLPLFLHAAERVAVEEGVELRHPFMDARLVDFALSIPEEQRRRGPYTKFVVREALGDDLPPSVRRRRTKGDFAHLVVEALERLGGAAFFESLQIADAGWIAADGARRTYADMRRQLPRGPEAYGQYVPELWALASVELWHRALFPRAAGRPVAVAV